MKKYNFQVIIANIILLSFHVLVVSCNTRYVNTGAYHGSMKSITLNKDSTYKYEIRAGSGIFGLTEGHWQVNGNTLFLIEDEKDIGTLNLSVNFIENTTNNGGTKIVSNLNEIFQDVFLEIYFDNELINVLNNNLYSFETQNIPDEIFLVAKEPNTYMADPPNRTLYSDTIKLDSINKESFIVQIDVNVNTNDFWRVSKGDMEFFIRSSRRIKSKEEKIILYWDDPQR